MWGCHYKRDRWFASDHRSFGVNDLCERRRKCLLPVSARAQASIFKWLDRQLYIVKAAHCETIIDVGACYYSRSLDLYSLYTILHSRAILRSVHIGKDEDVRLSFF